MNDFGALNAKVTLDTSGFSRGIRDVKEGFTSMGQKAMHLNQSLELITKGFRLFEGIASKTIAPIFSTGIEINKLNNSFNEIFQSTKAASEEFDFLRETSNRLGQNFYNLADSYKSIAAASRGTVLEGEETRKIFESITKASTSLGLSADETKGALLAISQMISKGTVSSEELRGQLGERLPGAFNLMAEAAGVSTSKLQKMLEQGEVGIDVLSRFADVLNKRYSGAVDPATQAVNKFEEAITDMKATIGSGEFMTAITDSINDISDAVKDPGFQDSLKELVTGMGGLVGFMADFAKYAGLRSISSTFNQAVELAGKGLIDMDKFAKASFLERQKLVDDILSKQKQIKALSYDESALKYLSGKFFDEPEQKGNYVENNQASEPSTTKSRVLKNVVEVSKEAEDAVRSLNKQIGDVRFETQITGSERFSAEIRKIQHEAVNMRVEYGKFFKEVPQLDALIGKWEDLRVAQVNAQKTDEAKQSIKDLNAQISGVSLEKTIIGMNQWDAALKQVDSDSASLREQYKALISQFPALGTAINKFSEAKNTLIEAQKVEETKREIKDLNNELANLSFENSIRSMTEWDATLATISKSSDDLRDTYKEMFGNIPAEIEKTIQALDNLKSKQAEIKVGQDLKALFNQEPQAYTSLFEFDDGGYSQALDDIGRQFDKMVAKGGEMSVLSGVWYDHQKGLLDFANTVGQVKGAFMSMTGAMGDALAEFAKTGKINLKDMARAMYDELVLHAASKTAQLLMEATFAGAMYLYSAASNDYISAGKWAAAGGAALSGAAMMGSFVAGAGLSGMAHDGISNIPEDGTWLLKKNERVIDSETNADLKDYLKGGGKGTTINMPVTINGGDEQSVLKALPLMKQVAVDAVNASISSRGDVFKTIQIMNPR
ncbi:MAG: tape measure protein [Desulfobacteraceae bacterium]|jgi:tape measure domain-containing protein